MGGPGSGRKKGSKSKSKKLGITIAGGKSEKKMIANTAKAYKNDPRVKAAKKAAAARKKALGK